MSRTEGFWSRRRAAVAAEATQAEAPVEPMPEVVEPRDDAEILAALGLPDPDTLRPGDDVAAFMARAVPAHLRRRALRRLWTSNPVLANVDSLVEYGGDFTDAGVKAGIVATAYEVGRGMTRHVERLAGDARADEAQGPGADGVGCPSAEEPDGDVATPIAGTSDPMPGGEGFPEAAAAPGVEAPARGPGRPADALVTTQTEAEHCGVDAGALAAAALPASSPRRMRFAFG